MAAGYTTLGQILGERGDLLGALQLFERAADLDPDGVAPRQYAAAALTHLGRTREACEAWRRAAQLRGGEGRARAERSRLGCERLESVPR